MADSMSSVAFLLVLPVKVPSLVLEVVKTQVPSEVSIEISEPDPVRVPLPLPAEWISSEPFFTTVVGKLHSVKLRELVLPKL